MQSLSNVTVFTNANVYFDGKCVSHTIETAEGARKSVGVILPSTLHFSTAAPELMQLIAGRCRVRLEGSPDWRDYAGGDSFEVAGDSGFDIEVGEALHYICHFG
jgi:uncharacterized protein YaiE (UPF0345 family)